ncbi:hypothetical protein H6F96_19255 [Microcoleus sp. FACHB-53]|nr:hypothetical protein [Microcoleus sp. FACHB-53]
MTNPLTLVKALDRPIIPRPKREKLKSRRERRLEARNTEKKIDRSSMLF